MVLKGPGGSPTRVSAGWGTLTRPGVRSASSRTEHAGSSRSCKAAALFALNPCKAHRGKDLELAPRRPHGRKPMKRGSMDAPRRGSSRVRHARLRKDQS